MASVAGWYADPAGKAELRYWDGSTWTDRTKDRADGAAASAPTAKSKPAAQPKSPRQRSEICVIGWTWTNTRETDRRRRKDFPYEIWFVANALGPNGLYKADQSGITFYTSENNYHGVGILQRYSSIVPRHHGVGKVVCDAGLIAVGS